MTRIARAFLVGAAIIVLAGCGQQPAAGPAAPAATPTAPLSAPYPDTATPPATPSPSVPSTALPTAPTATVRPPAPSPTPYDPTAIVLPRSVTPIPGWLHTDGTRVVDALGRTVTMAAVNWYGAEGPDFLPGGLDKRPYMDILLTIKALGFNTVRLPFSNELVESNPRIYNHLEANPDLIGRHALSIMDTLMEGARRAGIMVVLDDHRSSAGWSAYGNGRWYELPRYTPQSWIADWITLAQRYRDNPAVVGFDLRDEPHSNGPGTEILGLGYLNQGAMWGPYRGPLHVLAKPQEPSDWAAAAAQAGDAILRVNPRVLIIVEGTEIYPTDNGSGTAPDIYWWGGNLRGALVRPVRLVVAHQLVYSPHEYGSQMHWQRWFTPTMTVGDWQAAMERHWGLLLAQTGPDAAPVWIGEFGTPHRGDLDVYNTRPVSQGQWFGALIQYIHRTHVGWAYWSINGTVSIAHDVYPYGAPDAFGLLTPDWRHIARASLMQALRSIEPTR